MKNEDPYRDQADKLRQKIEKKSFEEGKIVTKEELPPRSRLHHNAKKNKFKLKYPIIRLLVLFFILLPVTVLSIYSSLSKDKPSGVKVTNGTATEVFESIDYENSEETEEDNKAKDVEQSESDAEESNVDVDSNQQDVVEPTEGETEEVVVSPSPVTAEKGIVYHTVQPGETIYRIAMTYYKSKAGIEIIKSTNKLQSNEIRVGQVLTIPLNK